MLSLYVELWTDADAKKPREKKADSKTKYTCDGCGLNASAKPKAPRICGSR
jgi:hypothetical protein